MNRKIFDYLEIAGKLAQSKADGRSFWLAAIGVRRDGAIVKAINSITQRPDRQIHSEYRLARKLDRGSVVYIARIRRDTLDFAMARPCKDCQKVLRSRGVKRVFYTIDPENFGVWDPMIDYDTD